MATPAFETNTYTCSCGCVILNNNAISVFKKMTDGYLKECYEIISNSHDNTALDNHCIYLITQCNILFYGFRRSIQCIICHDMCDVMKTVKLIYSHYSIAQHEN